MSEDKKTILAGRSALRFDEPLLNDPDPEKMAQAMERWAARVPADQPGESAEAWLLRAQRHILGGRKQAQPQAQTQPPRVASFAAYVLAKRAQARPGIEIRRKVLAQGGRMAAQSIGSAPLPAPIRIGKDALEVAFANENGEIIVTVQAPGGIYGSLERYKGRRDLVMVFGDPGYLGDELRNCYCEAAFDGNGRAVCLLPDIAEVRALLNVVSLLRLDEVKI